MCVAAYEHSRSAFRELYNYILLFHGNPKTSPEPIAGLQYGRERVVRIGSSIDDISPGNRNIV